MTRWRQVRDDKLIGVKVLVCGSRNFRDTAMVDLFLNKLDPILVICGGAPGADTLAARWAIKNDIPWHVFMADWARYGKKAGPIRNARMLKEGKPDLVLAFPGMRGTANMVGLARKAGVAIIDAEAGTVEITGKAFGGRKQAKLDWGMPLDKPGPTD